MTTSNLSIILQAYVLYLFLSLMLSYLNSDGGDGIEDVSADRSKYDDLIDYLEHKDPPPHLPLPFSLFYNKELPKGRDFLRFCKFGTMQVLSSYQIISALLH